MKSWIAFLKKEVLESVRSGKLTILGILFLLFGIMNPAMAKLTPWLFETLSDTLAESGMMVLKVEVDALTSWTQFFKNIPMALIVFVLVYSNTFTNEYQSGTLMLVLTKGLARYKVVLAKAAWMLFLWTAGYVVCFGTTYAYNAFFWDNAVAVGLVPAAVNWWLFGVFTVCLVVVFSTFLNSQAGVLLGTGSVVVISYAVGMFPKVKMFLPTALMNSAALLVESENEELYLKSVICTVVVCIVCLGVSIPILNKKQI